MLTLEFTDPSTTACECCGGTTTTLSAYVYEDDSAHAVYFARFSDNHPGRTVDLLVSIGGWGGAPDDKVAFALEMRALENGPAVMVVDATSSPWARDSETLGSMLTREQALEHSRLKEVFAVTDQMVSDDRILRAFLGLEQQS